MSRGSLSRHVLALLALVVTLADGCRKPLPDLSPSDVVRRYQKAQNKGDKEQLKVLTFADPARPPHETDLRIDQMVQAARRLPTAWRCVAGLFRIKVKGETVRGTTAYVYLWGSTILGGGAPFEIVVLERQDGIWKVKGPRRTVENPTVWQQQAEASPPDPDAVFLLGESQKGDRPVEFQSTVAGRRVFLKLPSSPELAYKQFKRYLELEPKGFWASVASSSVASYEKVLQDLTRYRDILTRDAKNPDALHWIGSYYEGNGQYVKANQYFRVFAASAPSQHRMARFAASDITNNELELAIQKEYYTAHPDELKTVEILLGYSLFTGVSLPCPLGSDHDNSSNPSGSDHDNSLRMNTLTDKTPPK